MNPDEIKKRVAEARGRAISHSAREGQTLLSDNKQEAQRELVRTIESHYDQPLVQNFGSRTPELMRGPFFGVGYTGQIPPGAFLAVAPMRSQDVIENFVSAWVNGDGEYGMWASRLNPAGATFGPGQRVRAPVTLLGPGECIGYDVPIEGLWVCPLTMWIGHSANSSPSTAMGGRTILNNRIPKPQPVTRLFTSRMAAVQRLGWIPVPWGVWLGTIPTAEPVDASGQAPVIGHSAVFAGTHVSLHFTRTTATVTRVLAADGDSEFEVWWLLSSGTWSHNGADDCDIDGRGVINSAHDVETYAVPRNAIAVYVRKTSGATLGVNIIVTDTEAGR